MAREVLKKLNRRHLEHLSRAPQHAQDKPPPPLNDLEGAVARVSLDDGLNEDEETLRTLGDQPVLIWHHTSCDPPEVDLTLNDALTLAEDIPRWAATPPAGCRPVGAQMHEIRRYDGDAEPVIARWAVGGEAPPVAGGPGGGGKQTKKGAKGNKGAGGREGGKGGAKPGGESQAKARPKRGRGKETGGKESGGPTRNAATVGKTDENKNGAKTATTNSAAARGAGRPRARSPRVQSTREPNASTPNVTPPAPTVTNDNQASQASRASDASRGGGRARRPSEPRGLSLRRRRRRRARPRFAAGLGVASRLRRGNSVGLRGAAAAAARGGAFAFL